MESGIRQYEAENKTGNPVLDTLLTAKSMECQEQGIRMTSVADGQWLGFLSTREICTLVGVPLDGLPRHNTHGGYDLRGVQAAARQHGGTMTVKWENSWFTVRILLPIPEKESM